jgi:hypothetical protein
MRFGPGTCYSAMMLHMHFKNKLFSKFSFNFIQIKNIQDSKLPNQLGSEVVGKLNNVQIVFNTF